MTAEIVSPWKSCDLRGTYPSVVSEDLYSRVARTLGAELREGNTVVVGGDFRLSTPALKSSLIRGLIETGLHVVDVGQVPTPVVYFHANRTNADAVFIVTASHNPAQHNGLKWMIGDLPPDPEDMARIQKAANSRSFRQGTGSMELIDPTPEYLDWIESRWDRLTTTLRPMKIVVDAGSGAWASLAPAVFARLGIAVIELHGPPDGRFPHRASDCARTANLAALRRAVVQHEAELGIAWDGDGDRVAFVDASGTHVSTDEISILFAREVLGKSDPGENVVCDIKLADGVRREVLHSGGIPLLERSGHTFMRSRLLMNRAVLGLDACGHYFFREAGSRDDGLYSAFFLLGMLGEQTLAKLRHEVPPIHSTPELRVENSVAPFGPVCDLLRAAFPRAEESNVDGVRLMLEEGVVLVRESSTEAVISLRIEGFTRDGYERLTELCFRLLPEAESVMRRQVAEAAGA